MPADLWPILDRGRHGSTKLRGELALLPPQNGSAAGPREPLAIICAVRDATELHRAEVEGEYLVDRRRLGLVQVIERFS